MIHDDALLPPRWRAAPSSDGVLGYPAAAIARLAWGLLACADAPLMTITLTTGGSARIWPTTIWDDHLAPSRHRTATLHATPMFGPALDALGGATAMLSRRIAALMRGSGARSVITDGVGVALIDGASGDDAGWLIAVARAESTSILQSFGRDGIWPLLTAGPP